MNIITLKILFANENLNINTHPIYYPYLIIEITKLIKLFFFLLITKEKRSAYAHPKLGSVSVNRKKIVYDTKAMFP